MRVLVLRPKSAGRAHRACLGPLGHEAVLAPLLEIAAIDGTGVSRFPIRNTLWRGDRRKPPRLHAAGCGKPGAARRRLPAMVVGARTARAAEKAGLRALRPVHRTARDLVLALPDQAPQGRLLYLAGRDRRPEIEQALRRKRRSFDIVEVYDATVMPALPLGAAAALRHREIDAVLHYSARSAKAYVTVAKAQRLLIRALAPRQLCLSKAVAEPLLEAGAKRLELAGAPNEASLLNLLRSPG